MLLAVNPVQLKLIVPVVVLAWFANKALVRSPKARPVTVTEQLIAACVDPICQNKKMVMAVRSRFKRTTSSFLCM